MFKRNKNYDIICDDLIDNVFYMLDLLDDDYESEKKNTKNVFTFRKY